MKKVDLQKILEKITSYTIDEDADLDAKENFYYKYEDVKKAMKEACRQVLELAAENAELRLFDFTINKFIGSNAGKHYSINDGHYLEVDKQSILNVIDQVE